MLGRWNAMFNKRYFSERTYRAYRLGLKRAVQHLYYSILCTASRQTSIDLLNGKGEKALDIGCAFGYVVELLCRLRYDVAGLDISTYAARIAHEASASTEPIIADARLLPFRRNTFSLITCFEVLEHISDPELLVEEIGASLKERGVCVLTTPVEGQVQGLYDLVRCEKTHVSLLKQKEAHTLMSQYVGETLISPYLMLPIPPEIFNRYFLLQHSPTLISSGMMITSVKKGS